ncbi:MAG: M14 family metallopeptidase, partial [bacterium]
QEALAYILYLSGFPNVSLIEYGKTYEGRPLYYLVVTSEANSKNLTDIRRGIAALADPRLIEDEDEAARIIAETPAVAWLAYSIHGDELSSTDAALQVAYQILAGEDETTRKIRDEVVVCIDPLQNPDGRERWVKQVEQWNGVVPNEDTQSMQHRGVWPYGRGNHYLADINRDWLATVYPETRGKIKAILEWNPQFLTDSHEMGPLDTYLFSPPREPFNPYMVPQIHKWWDVFAKDQAAAFDRYGWSYYTREWNEEFYPGYGSSWGIYTGAVGMLYEQAGVDGSLVKRRDGTVMTFRETIHHQFTSSVANVTTVAMNRKELLEDFFAEKKQAVGGAVGAGIETTSTPAGGGFVFPPSENEGRLRRFVETLGRQNFEILVTKEAATLGRGVSAGGEAVRDVELPEGTVIVPLDQPLRALVEVTLDFDIRMPTKFLETERRELLKNNETRLYEVTAWSLPLAYNVECYRTEKLPGIKTAAAGEAGVASGTRAGGGLVGDSPNFGYVFSIIDDRSYSALAKLFAKNYKMWAAKKAFKVDGREFPPGSLLITRSGNPGINEAELEAIAVDAGVEIYRASTALAASGVDLGGEEFSLLQTPRIGIVGGSGTSTASFGGIWHLLDNRLTYPMSALDVAALRRMDLRKYNVIVLPSAWGGAEVYKSMLGEPEIEKLKAWVESGGTLIAIGAATAFLADSSVALSSVRPRRQVLSRLDDYERVLAQAKEALTAGVDSVAVWEGSPEGAAKKKTEKQDGTQSGAGKSGEASKDKTLLEEADKLARRFSPHGAILAVDLDDTHWLSFGARSPVPVMMYSDYAFLAGQKVQVAARFAGADKIRLSGLLWPEARNRLSETAYATSERRGNGQVVLFAGLPEFRGYFHGSERLLLNAIFLGPGFGTNQAFY